MSNPTSNNPFLRAIAILEGTLEPYLLVGGFAVVMHGIGRFTADLNVMVDLNSPSSRKVVDSFVQQGFIPQPPKKTQAGSENFETPPTSPLDISNPQLRATYRAESKHFCFSLYDPQAPSFTVQFLLENPLPFQESFQRRMRIDLPTVSTNLPALQDLIDMKAGAGRLQDQSDIDQLVQLQFLHLMHKEGRSTEEFLVSSSSNEEREARTHIAEFSSKSASEKLEWLEFMLTQLGQFCVL